jgi:hypothetical protein
MRASFLAKRGSCKISSRPHHLDQPWEERIGGGRDKDLPWEDLAALIHERVDHVVLFGEAAEKIEKAVASTPNTAMDTPSGRQASRAYNESFDRDPPGVREEIPMTLVERIRMTLMTS